jgi:two-component system, OmpR family, heavy metal sensor histidine kinase CusS
MRSIGLSLMVYFLGLLAVALGVASVIGYETSKQTLESKKDATAQLIEAQYAERCRAEERRLDDDLLAQAQTLARVAHIRFDWNRLRYHELNALGLLAVSTAPNAYLLAPSWVGQGVHGQYSLELNRKNLGEITFDDREVLEQVSRYYFQIDSVWGASERSGSLGEHYLPIAPDAFTPEQGSPWKSTDYNLAPVGSVRRVTLKTSAPITPTPRRGPRGRADFGRDDRPGPPPPPPQPLELQPRSAIFVQCAASTSDRDLAIAALKGRRDDALSALDAETNLSLAKLRNRLLLTGGVAFLLAVVGCFGLVRLGLSPLRRLSDAVSRVSEKDFRLQVDRRRMPGELQPIIGRLMTTLEMLKRAFAREKQATADISHELRTPLSALLTMTEMSLRKPRSTEEYQEVLRDCRLSAKRMTQGVERLLALARLDAGVDRLRPVPIDAADLAEQCAALVRPLAEARGLTLTIHRNGAAPVTADPDKLREVLTSLLHNAIEYNRPNGAVDLTVARENGHLDVAVKDTGVGISPEAKAHLFERFYRADPSRGGDGLHTGLGLAIAKGYVDLMGGDLAVESVEGEGSTFRIRLPAHRAIVSLQPVYVSRGRRET